MLKLEIINSAYEENFLIELTYYQNNIIDQGNIVLYFDGSESL